MFTFLNEKATHFFSKHLFVIVNAWFWVKFTINLESGN